MRLKAHAKPKAPPEDYRARQTADHSRRHDPITLVPFVLILFK
jgi:TPP-dependent pyruvate/acetoin dehydrogenase alpha subunit